MSNLFGPPNTDNLQPIPPRLKPVVQELKEKKPEDMTETEQKIMQQLGFTIQAR